MGSKSRIAKYIVPILQSYIDKNNCKLYIEPFCGGCNIIDKIKCDKKIGSDNQEYLIELFKNLELIQTLPNTVTKEHYAKVRDCFNNKNNDFEKWYIGAIGFLASYNGRFFDGGYAGKIKTKTGITRDYFNEAKRNLLNQIPNLMNIQFIYGDYKKLYSHNSFNKAMIYCDIPYKNTKKYGSSKNFDYENFWKWASEMSQNNIVIVSENIAPIEWECIWEQEVKRTIDNTKRVKSTERLFILKNNV